MIESLEHREPDRPPVFELMINSPAAEAIMGRPMMVGIGASMAGPRLHEAIEAGAVREFIGAGFRDHLDLYASLDLDIVVLPGTVYGLLFGAPLCEKADDSTYNFSTPSGDTRWTVKVDLATDTWGETDHSLLGEGLPGLARLVSTMEQAGPFKPDPDITAYLRAFFASRGDRFILGSADVLMPNHNAWFGLFLEAMVLAPELVERYVEATTRIMIGHVDLLADAGCHGLVGGTDFAGVNGPFFSPAMFRRFYKRPLSKLIARCHERGMFFIKHTDGNVNTIFDELFVDTGADAFHAIEPAGMDICALKKSHGRRLSLWGNVDCGRLLCGGTEAEVRAEVRRLMGVCAPGGGYVLSSSNSIHGGVRPGNFLAMLDEARRS